MRWALAILFAAASTVHAGPWGVAELFDALAKQRPERTTFQETKFLALLDKPVESSGELVFTPPDRLEKHTLAPKPESLVVDRDTVTVERAGKRHALRLAEAPQVAVLVESIRSTLAGDLASLTRSYAVALDGTPGRWRLVLRPLDPTLGTLVERVEIGGSETRLRTIEIFQPDGDRSVMTIAPQK